MCAARLFHARFLPFFISLTVYYLTTIQNFTFYNPVTFFVLESNILLNAVFSCTLSLFFTPKERDQISKYTDYFSDISWQPELEISGSTRSHTTDKRVNIAPVNIKSSDKHTKLRYIF